MCGGVGYGTRCTGYRNEEQSPSSQASARSRASAGIEEEGGLMAKTEEVWTQLATRVPTVAGVERSVNPLRLCCGR